MTLQELIDRGIPEPIAEILFESYQKRQQEQAEAEARKAAAEAEKAEARLTELRALEISAGYSYDIPDSELEIMEWAGVLFPHTEYLYDIQNEEGDTLSKPKVYGFRRPLGDIPTIAETTEAEREKYLKHYLQQNDTQKAIRVGQYDRRADRLLGCIEEIEDEYNRIIDTHDGQILEVGIDMVITNLKHIVLDMYSQARDVIASVSDDKARLNLNSLYNHMY